MSNNKKFVFVLGAGASRDFNYPTGTELIETITKYKSDSVFIKFLKDNGIFSRDVNIFVDVLKRSGDNSIDTFLTRVVDPKRSQPIDFENIGRACITYAILSVEKQSKALETPFRFEDNWYRHLFCFIDDNYEALVDGRVRFLTFNYDLSLEYFIATSYRIRNYLYSMSVEERKLCKEFLSTIKIMHLYGQVGSLSDFDGVSREYGVLDELFDVSRAYKFWQITKKIEIVRPQALEETQSLFNQAQKYLTEADYIFFLGFGFDPLNMDRLGLCQVFQSGIEGKRFYVTAYKADNSSIYNFENRIFHVEELKERIYTIGGKDEKIVPFLKDKCFVLSQLKD